MSNEMNKSNLKSKFNHNTVEHFFFIFKLIEDWSFTTLLIWSNYVYFKQTYELFKVFFCKNKSCVPLNIITITTSLLLK